MVIRQLCRVVGMVPVFGFGELLQKLIFSQSVVIWSTHVCRKQLCVCVLFLKKTLSNKVRNHRIFLGIGILYLNGCLYQIAEKSSLSKCSQFWNQPRNVPLFHIFIHFLLSPSLPLTYKKLHQGSFGIILGHVTKLIGFNSMSGLSGKKDTWERKRRLLLVFLGNFLTNLSYKDLMWSLWRLLVYTFKRNFECPMSASSSDFLGAENLLWWA